MSGSSRRGKGASLVARVELVPRPWNPQKSKRQFDEVCDQAIVHHGFVDYMRDYEIFVYCAADPKTGIAPETIRLLFKNCVVSVVETALSVETWHRSLDDRLVDYATGVDLDRYVWVSSGN